MCVVRFHTVNLFDHRGTRVFIRTQPITRILVYLDTSFAITSVHLDIIRLLLPQEHSVDAWSSILRRLLCLGKKNALILVGTMTSSGVTLKYITIPFKMSYNSSTATPDLWEELTLIQDIISSDSSIADVSLRSTWEDISFLKALLLQVIKTV